MPIQLCRPLNWEVAFSAGLLIILSFHCGEDIVLICTIATGQLNVGNAVKVDDKAHFRFSGDNATKLDEMANLDLARGSNLEEDSLSSTARAFCEPPGGRI